MPTAPRQGWRASQSRIAVAEGDCLLECGHAVLAIEVGFIGCTAAMRECRDRHVEEGVVSGPLALIVHGVRRACWEGVPRTEPPRPALGGQSPGKRCSSRFTDSGSHAG